MLFVIFWIPWNIQGNSFFIDTVKFGIYQSQQTYPLKGQGDGPLSSSQDEEKLLLNFTDLSKNPWKRELSHTKLRSRNNKYDPYVCVCLSLFADSPQTYTYFLLLAFGSAEKN